MTLILLLCLDLRDRHVEGLEHGHGLLGDDELVDIDAGLVRDDFKAALPFLNGCEQNSAESLPPLRL